MHPIDDRYQQSLPEKTVGPNGRTGKKMNLTEDNSFEISLRRARDVFCGTLMWSGRSEPNELYGDDSSSFEIQDIPAVRTEALFVGLRLRRPDESDFLRMLNPIPDSQLGVWRSVFDPGLWKAVFDKVAEIGLKGNRLVLLVLVVAATIWVSLGVSPWVCVAFMVLVYSTHQGFKLIDLFLQNRADQLKLTLKKSEYSGFVVSKRQERSEQEPPVSNRRKAPRRLRVKGSDDTRAT